MPSCRRDCHPKGAKHHKPIIPFESDYDESSLELVSHEWSQTNAAGVSSKIVEKIFKLPTDPTPYLIMKFFSSFATVCRNQQWTSGPVLFQRFQMQLLDIHLKTWESQIVGVAQTVNSFNNEFRDFRDKLLRGYSYYDQMDYLREARLSFGQQPSNFVRKMLAAESAATQLPDASNNAGFSVEERKRNLYKAMPAKWRGKFDTANMHIEAEELASMRGYFDRL